MDSRHARVSIVAIKNDLFLGLASICMVVQGSAIGIGPNNVESFARQWQYQILRGVASIDLSSKFHVVRSCCIVSGGLDDGCPSLICVQRWRPHCHGPVVLNFECGVARHLANNEIRIIHGSISRESDADPSW